VKKTPVAILAASILLTACGGGAKPDPSSSFSTTTSTSAPTVSVSPTTAGPTIDPNIPAAARAHTPAGAEAFVRYFIERVNLAWTGPRAGIVAPLCQASSKACAAYEKEATRLAKEGHRYDGNPVTIKFIGVLDATKTTKYEVLANLVQERRSQIDGAGKIYVTDTQKNLRLDFALLYADLGWSVATIKIMQ
jgi:hypothetical protein